MENAASLFLEEPWKRAGQIWSVAQRSDTVGQWEEAEGLTRIITNQQRWHRPPNTPLQLARCCFYPSPLPETLLPDRVGVRDVCGCTVTSPESPPPPCTPSQSWEKTHVCNKRPNIPRIVSLLSSFALNLWLREKITSCVSMIPGNGSKPKYCNQKNW